MITKMIFDQYEKIRLSGKCNMFDINCVKLFARRKGYYALSEVSQKDYLDIIQNYDYYKETWLKNG